MYIRPPGFPMMPVIRNIAFNHAGSPKMVIFDSAGYLLILLPLHSHPESFRYFVYWSGI